jgi:hypothetical protein
MRRQHVLGEDDELRPDQRSEYAAGQNPRHGLGPERIARGVSSGEAVRLMRGGIEPAAEGAEQQDPERAAHHRRIRDKSRSDTEQRAGLQREAAAVMARKPADRQRADPHAEDHAGDRQRGEALIGREHRADDARGRNDDGVVATGQSLRDRQHDRITLGEPVVENVRQGLGDGRHEAIPGQKRSLFSGRKRRSLLLQAQGWVVARPRIRGDGPAVP